MLTVVLFLLVLSLVVLVHEAGHFLVARRSGMRVFEFGWGFPPRLVGWYRDPATKKWRVVWGSGKSSAANTGGGAEREAEFPSTLYSINWLPLGGFVKIKGENGENTVDPDSFGAKKFWPRLLTIVAGVAMNVVLAAVLLSIGFMIGLPTDTGGLNDPHAIVVKPPAVMIQQVDADSPAAKAGLQFGDTVTTLNGERLLSANDMVNFVQTHPGQELTLTVEHPGAETRTTTLTPAVLKTGDIPRLGVMLADAGVIRYPWYLAIYKGVIAAGIGLINIFIALYLLIKNLVLGNGMLFPISGPVGVAVAVGQSAKLGFNYLLNVTVMISLSLAALNILPIPALDGGRALFIVLEKIIGRKIPTKYEQVIHTIGFLALLILIGFVTWRDIRALL